MSTDTQTLVIKSSEWLRCPKGNKNFSSGMFRQGRYCCLGLDARREGAKASGMHRYISPDGLNQAGLTPSQAYANRWLEATGHNNARAARAMSINDDPHTTDEEKIARLRPIFAEVGITIDFRPNE